jgi:hypothetical protein
VNATLTKGFVFLNGEYLSPPYEIREGEQSVIINGQALPSLLPDLEAARRDGLRMEGPRGEGPRGPGQPGMGPPRGNPIRYQALEILRQLEGNGVILAFAEQPLIRLDGGSTYELFKLLLSDGDYVKRVSLVERLPAELDRDLWNGWLDRYAPPPELRSRSAGLITAFDAAEREAMSAIAATRRINDWAYPLTIGGFVITVLAVGHLLGGRPHAGKSRHGRDDSPEMIRALNWTLVLIALMSLLDLTWTILAAQANQMRELNPFGSHLVEDPRHLVGFKVGATFPSLALLWLLRGYKRAQIAAWWICLLLTVLAFRWLAFNSTMVAA